MRPWFERNALLLFFALFKLGLHLFANTRYGFHRDEYLYLAQGKHLAWGYIEVPPFIGWLAGLAWLGGAELWLVRLFPTLVGVVTVLLIGWTVRRLGGPVWAQALAMMGPLIAPALLRAHMLFQPVAFNQLWWLVAAVLVVQLIRTQQAAYWYGLGAAAGLGMLTKYSIAFWLFGLIGGLALSPQRKRWLFSPHPYLAVWVALFLWLPNLWWQVQHRWPVLAHMEELRRTQLVNVEAAGFLVGQALMLFAASLIALPGLWYLLFSRPARPYRPLGIAFLIMLAVLTALSGKVYYSLGGYLILFVFGGLALNQWLPSPRWKGLFAAALVAFSLVVLPYALPVLPLNKMVDYGAFMRKHFGLSGPLVWEDGRLYDLPQDYADMCGWEEMAEKVGRLYQSLPEAVQDSCSIFGGSYGHAGALNYYGAEWGIPKAQSFNGSFVLWLPQRVNFTCQIIVEDRKYDSPQPYFQYESLVDSVRHPFARDPGYIYLRRHPRVNVDSAWHSLVVQARKRYQGI